MATYAMKVVTPWRQEPGRNDMLVAEEYPAAWSDITGQEDAAILAGNDALVVMGESLSETQVSAIRADARFTVLWVAEETEEGVTPPDALTPEQVETVRTSMAAVLSPDVAKLVTEEVSDPEQIAAAVVEATKRPPWRVGITVQPGEVYYHAGNLYEVIQGHKTQSDWPPNRVAALFKRFYEPSDDPWPWVAPTGAHDAYPEGARVLHDGATWVSNIAANVWEPGSVGAEALWTREGGPEPPTGEWVSGEQGIQPGDRRTYQGVTYECIQNPGINIWPPPTVPALWQVVT